jgi:hypothetical protein
MTRNLSARMALPLLLSLTMAGPVMSDQAAPDSRGATVPDALRSAVLADAVRRAGNPSAHAALASAELVTWPDASLGCPQPGVGYTQALVPGWRMTVQAGGVSLLYHANLRGTRWLHCDAARAQAPLPVDPRS